MDPIIPQPEQLQYQTQVPEPKHFLNKKFAITLVILLLLGVGASYGIWWWGNQNSQVAVLPATPDPTANWKTYTNTQYGFEIKYPENFIIKDGEKGVSVSHGVPYIHSDPCDFRDGTHILNEVVDFNATLKVFNGNIESAVKANYAFPNDIIESGQFKLSQDFVDAYSVGSLNGYRVKIGAEGCGLSTYYFTLDSSHALVVSQLTTPERTSLILDYEKFLSLPGIIKPADEEKIFNQILSTFKFTR